MSTRRARIKAVATLPPRRKNLENTEGKKPKDATEKILRSPSKTPRSPVVSTEDRGSPINNLRSPPALLPINVRPRTVSPVTDSILKSPPICDTIKSPPPELIRISSPRKSIEKDVTAKSENPVIVAKRSVFASPPPRDSPDQRQVPSPLDLSSPIARCKTPNTLGHNSPSVPKYVGTKTKDPNYVNDLNTSSSNDPIINLNSILSNQQVTAIDQLRTQIVSEYDDVLFDPIMPMPSPTKVRTKLRPVPRLGPYRRNSIQGSASESEDESRRSLLSGGASTPGPHRQRHESFTMATLTRDNTTKQSKADLSQNHEINLNLPQPPPATSPVKEKSSSKNRRQETTKRSYWRRREPKRDTLTMYDLIFYNPPSNPIVPDQEELEAKEANAKEEADRNSKTAESDDEVDADTATAEAAPVPQIKIGPNGEIVLDEKSLVIQQSDANRKVSSVVREGAWGAGGGRYTRAARTADWPEDETIRFYRALAAIGTDFTLMAPMFPGRTRRDLYLKFKKEEKLNNRQVDKALRSSTTWDASRLHEEFKREREEAAKKAALAKRKLEESRRAEKERLKASKDMKIRNSKAAKAIEACMMPGANSKVLTGDEFIERTLEFQPITRSKRKSIPHKLNLPEIEPVEQRESFPTVTLIDSVKANPGSIDDMATITKVSDVPTEQLNLDGIAGVPSNIEHGSLVVLRVNDPSSPSKTMLQTYIAQGSGKLTPVALPPTFLSSVMGYMQKGTPKSSMKVLPQECLEQSNVMSSPDESRAPSVIQVNPSPVKRQRHSSYTITSL